ncbi:MAG: hypothetical protein K9N23_04725 [Akkermansiaceae bacterium]|nr:hypothetical protein [Akkermansiaceae bacterium]MCF7730965.1 hypothetical protein [Akkermansiaceae bacterium]
MWEILGRLAGPIAALSPPTDPAKDADDSREYAWSLRLHVPKVVWEVTGKENQKNAYIIMDTQNTPKTSAIPGLAIIGLILTGIAGIVHAFLSGAAVSLLAAALAFGTLLYVSFRKDH